jgi:hypothetical protein
MRNLLPVLEKNIHGGKRTSIGAMREAATKTELRRILQQELRKFLEEPVLNYSVPETER